MLATILLVAATQVTTHGSMTAHASQPAAVVRHYTRHELHELHIEHLQYLHWLHAQKVAASRRSYSTPRAQVTVVRTSPGVFSCSGLETLWRAAGGNPASAFLAAEIAMAESGGQSWAVSPTDDYGLWQINSSHGALATLDPYGNARAAIIISDNGRSWAPWTTYVSGAYIGRCLRRCRLA